MKYTIIATILLTGLLAGCPILVPNTYDANDPPPQIFSLSQDAIKSLMDKPPVANAGADKSVDGDFTLNGSQSTDPDHDRLSFYWEQVNGTPLEISNPFAGMTQVKVPGGTSTVAVFRLIVSDGYRSSSDEISVEVQVK
jgi:hypothetical protein